MTDEPISHVPVTEWAPLVPELTVSDLARSLSVYTELFGFTVLYTRPGFAYLSHGRAQLMLEQERAGNAWQTGPLERPYGRGINFQLEVPDVRAVSRDWNRRATRCRCRSGPPPTLRARPSTASGRFWRSTRTGICGGFRTGAARADPSAPPEPPAAPRAAAHTGLL
ncbi:hypothetical protein SAMN04488058_11648 [Deinococcus reticulitermitis]|uniref:Glyoxalase/fosfomycin resistance/dioxygenase domain-containing protein n=1 Tax=Deinococcus reticulitermitis TaxID=856736 RepID=A0A1H7BB13_9DEIO|nr:hypothetical protein SAMN04488058_11648 [Deinococcus reticulitermitis]